MTNENRGAQNASPTEPAESPSNTRDAVATAGTDSQSDAATESKGCAGQEARTDESNGQLNKYLADSQPDTDLAALFDEYGEYLPRIQREDFRAVEIEGRTPPDQARERGVSNATVHANVKRAKERLRDIAAERGDLVTDGGAPPATCTCCGIEFPPDGECRAASAHNFVAFDGGVEIGTEWTLTCLDCDFGTAITTEGHPRDGPPDVVRDRVTTHKHTTDESHIVRVAGRRADRDDNIDPSLLTDGSGLLTGGDERPDAAELTQFQLDILAILAHTGTGEEEDYGLAIKRALEAYSGKEVNHGRLYPNLDDLIEKGLVERSEIDKRTNQYTLTTDGEYVLRGRLDWLADQAGFHTVNQREPSVVNGEGGAAGGVE